MDKNFGVDAVTLLHKNISNVFDDSWDRDLSLEKFVEGCHSRLDKISKLDMSSVLNGHLLQKHANRNSYDRNLVIDAAEGAHHC